jgi:hypothetical protein
MNNESTNQLIASTPTVEYMDGSNSPPDTSATATPPSPTESPSQVQPGTNDLKKMTDLVKLERRLAKKEQEAKQLIADAERYKGAFDDSDMVSALTKLGLNPEEVYRKMTKHALDQISKKPLDPKDQELQDTKEQLREYKSAQDKLIQDLNNERAMQAHQKAMTDKVAPIINANPDEFQVLIATFGDKDKAIAKVYEECYNEYCRTETVIDPKEAAEAMEAYYYDIQKQAITNASKLSKFKDFFRQEADHAPNEVLSSDAEQFSKALSAKLDSPLHTDSPKPSKTLSDNSGFPSSGKIDYLARFLKEKGI